MTKIVFFRVKHLTTRYCVDRNMLHSAIDVISITPHCAVEAGDAVAPLPKIFWAKLIGFGQIWLNLGEIWAKVITFSQFDLIWAKSKSCISKNNPSPSTITRKYLRHWALQHLSGDHCSWVPISLILRLTGLVAIPLLCCWRRGVARADPSIHLTMLCYDQAL